MAERALALLAMREHSEKELQQKLITRGFNAEVVSEVITQLKQQGSQSDHRFTDDFVHSRIAKGYGPLRIRQELREKAIADDLIETLLTDRDEDWMLRLASVREKKFGQCMPTDYKEQARQSRFLQYRGFSSEHIRRGFKAED